MCLDIALDIDPDPLLHSCKASVTLHSFKAKKSHQSLEVSVVCIYLQVESRIRASLQSEVERMTQDALARLTQTPATPTRPQVNTISVASNKNNTAREPCFVCLAFVACIAAHAHDATCIPCHALVWYHCMCARPHLAY